MDETEEEINKKNISNIMVIFLNNGQNARNEPLEVKLLTISPFLACRGISKII